MNNGNKWRKSIGNSMLSLWLADNRKNKTRWLPSCGCIYTGWNDKIVALEKTTWFHFRLMKTGFLFFFFFVADHLLVGQLCTNPKSDRSLLSCLKVTQCSTSEIRDVPLYNSCSLPIQVMTTGPLPAPSKCKSGLPRIAGTCSGWWKQSFRLQLWFWCGFKWGPHYATSHLRSRLESQHQNVLECAEECGDPLVQSGGRWQTLGVAAGLSVGPQVQRDPGLASGVLRLCTLLSLPPPPPTWTRWTTSFGHTSRILPTWPPTTPKPAWSPPSTEYSPSSHRRLWKWHAPSSGSVSRRWLRLKAATLNWCQLYCIIKLPEWIFSIKVLR